MKTNALQMSKVNFAIKLRTERVLQLVLKFYAIKNAHFWICDSFFVSMTQGGTLNFQWRPEIYWERKGLLICLIRKIGKKHRKKSAVTKTFPFWLDVFSALSLVFFSNHLPSIQNKRTSRFLWPKMGISWIEHRGKRYAVRVGKNP